MIEPTIHNRTIQSGIYTAEMVYEYLLYCARTQNKRTYKRKHKYITRASSVKNVPRIRKAVMEDRNAANDWYYNNGYYKSFHCCLLCNNSKMIIIEYVQSLTQICLGKRDISRNINIMHFVPNSTLFLAQNPKYSHTPL